jgi:hypothetical protein
MPTPAPPNSRGWPSGSSQWGSTSPVCSAARVFSSPTTGSELGSHHVHEVGIGDWRLTFCLAAIRRSTPGVGVTEESFDSRMAGGATGWHQDGLS